MTAFRFVDDLFLGYERFIRSVMAGFADERVGGWASWDATGRINILHRADDRLLDLMVDNGLREVALGVESGSERVLRHMGKRITPDMTRSVVARLTDRGIGVKGYFILGSRPRPARNWTPPSRTSASCGGSPTAGRGGFVPACSSSAPTRAPRRGIGS